MRCSQCSNLAVYYAPIGPLCLNCTSKFQQIIDSQITHSEKMVNFLMDEIDMVTGIPLGGPRFPERKPAVIQNAPVTMNTYTFDRSIVGSVNTGYVHQLEISMSSVTQVNDSGAEKIKKFAEAILKEEKLEKHQKNEIIQQLNFLSQQLLNPREKQNGAVIRSVISGISNLINLSASLVTLFEPVKTLFHSV